MEERTTNSVTTRVPQFVDMSKQDSRYLSVGGTGIRIDGQHSTSSSASRNSDSGSSTPTPSQPRANNQLLLDAGLLVQQLQAQLKELGQREAAFEQKQAELDADRRGFESFRQDQLSEIEQGRLQLQSEETGLHERMAADQMLLERIDAEKFAVEKSRTDLDRYRDSIRQEMESNLRIEREALEETKGLIAEERARVHELSESLEHKVRIANQQAEQLIKSERDRLWQTLLAEWEERRNQFQSEYDLWKSEVESEKREIEREKAFYESAIREAEASFAAAQ
ncbi:MAG: hypothetical protein FJ267_18130, partial [Planctomycetes bacterium]|nr:hypothetical protein [Planctomycetota bacterium]